MTQVRWPRISALVMFMVLASPPYGFARQGKPADDAFQVLSGAWVRNPALSEDGAKVMADARGGSRGRSGREGGTGGGRGGSMAGRPPRPQDTEGDRAQMTQLMAAPDRLTITVAPGVVTFVDADGLSQTFATTNREEKHYFGDRMVTSRTKWDAGRLTRELTFEGGVKRTETFALLAGEPRRLRLAIEIKGARLPREITFQSTYDDAKAR